MMGELQSAAAESYINDMIDHFAPFEDMSKHCKVHPLSKTSMLNFRVGQPISERKTLPAQIFVVLEGECRLKGDDQGRLITLNKIGAGEFIGLSSLLRAEPCEEVSAITTVVAAAIPDEVIVDLYSEEASFRDWCDGYRWPCEVADLVNKLLSKDPNKNRSFQQELEEVLQGAQLVKKNRVDVKRRG